MKLLVCGSRSIKDENVIFECLDKTEELLDHKISEIIHGGAEGVDIISGKWASLGGIKTTIMKPLWNKYGKIAGFMRNSDMVQYCDKGIAIWDDKSNGTNDTINKLKINNKLLKVFHIT